MRPLTLLIGGIFTSAVSANSLFGENAFEILTFNSVRSIGQPALHGRSLQKRQCMATCSNGGCCNTGGPCTTDGQCCSTGEIACSDGGCCKTGETCTSVNGTQVCQGALACAAPPVTCGSSCCDAGMTCVTSGTNFRCQSPAATSSSSKSSTSSVSHPPLGNPTNRTNTVSVSFTGIASGTKVIPYVTPTTFPSASGTGASASTSSASSSAAKQSLSVSGLQML